MVVGAASICRAADITYDVNQAVGVGRVTGDIVTDGKIGVLAQADILDWNLLLNNSLSTFDLLGPLSGSNSGVVNSGLNLTATASQLLFNFSGTSYVLFQNPSPGSGLSSFCLETSAIDCSHGAGEFLQVGNQNNPPGGQFTALSGTHVIATTTTTALNVTGPALYYANYGPSPLPGGGQPPGEYIAYSAESVVPNGDAATNGVGVATTGVATTTNQNTQSTITRPINFLPGPIDPNIFFGTLLLCTTTCTPSANNNPSNLTGSWTLTFQNAGTTPTSVSNTLSLVGPGEIGFPQSITLSGTSGNPTFTWSAPPGPIPDGYRIVIYQNDVVGPGNTGQVVAKELQQPSYTVNAADFTVPGYQLMPGVTYTIELEDLTTRNGSTTNLGNPNLSAASRVFTSFQILPAGTPLVNLPTFTSVGNQVVYGFQLTVEPGITYYIDPAVATGYIYQTGLGDPNFASVELPDIGNPNPYDLYLWNGSAFVFDTTLAADTAFDFAPGGVSEFEVFGIDPALGLDPDNTTAFITGLTFESAGNFTGTMTPITANVSGVPEPASLTLLASGLLGLVLIRRRRPLI